ncbi:MAG: hypothetical protein ACKVU4_03700 [Phycisphaerales bacterium]
MSDAPLMVGVSGLRGITGRSLTPEVAARFAGAFGGWVKAAKRPAAAGELRSKAADTAGSGTAVVVIGTDGRAGFEPIHAAAIAGLSAAGCEVVDLGVAMTPTIGVMVDHLDAAGGMVVTASHNPQEWNGLKCLVRAASDPGRAAACAPDASSADAIVARFRAAAAPPTRSPAPVDQRGDGARAHVQSVLAAIGPDAARAVRGRRIRVLLDSVNGAGRFGGRDMLLLLGCELIHHGAEDGGVFPHKPEPTKENLVTLGAGVMKFNAQVGFAQDPDADRLAIVDEEGNYIGEEYTLALAAEAVLGAGRDGETERRRDEEKTRRVLVANLSTSRMIDDVAARHSARVIRTPVGEANVVAAMKRERDAGHDVVLGGEGNGGVIWPRVTYVRDSLSAMALVLALMARTGKSIRELVAAIPAYAIEKRKVDLARKEDAQPTIRKIAAAYAPPSSSPPHLLTSSPAQGSSPRIDLQDGVRVDWDGPLPGGGSGKAWLHVRASNTEPIMRLIAEAPTPQAAAAILDDAARVIGHT